MIDFMALTPAEVERFIHIQAVIDRQKIDADKINDYRDYYKGEHPVLLTLRQQEFLGELLTGSDFPLHHNVSRVVIDTLRERLIVSGLTVNNASIFDADGENTDANIAVQMWAWWEENRLNSQQTRLYRRMLRDGKSYVMVDYDSVNMRPRMRLHKIDDGVTGIVLHRDPEDPETILFANRYFFSSVDPRQARNGSPLATSSTTGIPRKTVYLPHEIRKYIMDKAGSWQPHMDDGDEAWPIPWVDMIGEPIGINVFEFENPGGSELESVIGLQNALNKSWVDLIAAADQSGFPMLAIEYKESLLNDMNVGDDSNLEGTDELRIAPGRALEVTGASIKRIEAANLMPMIDTIWTLTMAISGVSKVPHHHLKPLTSTANISGETIKQLEAGLTKRIEEKQMVVGQSWQDVFAMAYKLESIFGRGTRDLEVRVDVIWEDTQIRDDKSDAEAARLHKEIGVPDEAIFERLGYTPEQIQGFEAKKRQDRAREIASIAGALRTNELRNAPQVNPPTFSQNGGGL